jgi:hypothetical protein
LVDPSWFCGAAVSRPTSTPERGVLTVVGVDADAPHLQE